MGNVTGKIIEGDIECSTPLIQAKLYDHASCFFFQLPEQLVNYKFGYISLAFVSLVLLISIFGKIQYHYRWFVLHMALIDLLLCYDFICHKPILGNKQKSQCYFGLDTHLSYNSRLLEKLPGCGLLILTGSRFWNVYFSDF